MVDWTNVCASPHHEEPPQGGVSNGDFAQDEVLFYAN
jgi:hypothetical protein